jgi:hypothetical protein
MFVKETRVGDLHGNLVSENPSLKAAHGVKPRIASSDCKQIGQRAISARVFAYRAFRHLTAGCIDPSAPRT